MPTIREIIIEKLNKELEPSQLEVIDSSHKHFGHSGWREEGETHFDLIIKSDRLHHLNRVSQHKLIYQILASEMKVIHALAIKVL